MENLKMIAKRRATLNTYDGVKAYNIMAYALIFMVLSRLGRLCEFCHNDYCYKKIMIFY